MLYSPIALYDCSSGAARFLMHVARTATALSWSILQIVPYEQPTCPTTCSIVKPITLSRKATSVRESIGLFPKHITLCSKRLAEPTLRDPLLG
jgi:hypothetical protein